jgi:hypothetical protein
MPVQISAAVLCLIFPKQAEAHSTVENDPTADTPDQDSPVPDSPLQNVK